MQAAEPRLPPLTIEAIKSEALAFAKIESAYPEPSLFGVTDGKAVGTYLEQKFTAHLHARYKFPRGNSASGIDIPSLGVDIKVTSRVQPQSSCPFKSARQKVFGLGYSLLVFVYTKQDDPVGRTATLGLNHVVFIGKECTADYQMTSMLNRIVANAGNEDDLVAFMSEKLLPVDEIEMRLIAQEVLAVRCVPVGFLTISNALQWRLQYTRAIENAGLVSGIIRVV